MENNPSITIMKKRMQEAVVYELYKKGVISFFEYNVISKKLEEDRMKLETKIAKKDTMTNSTVKIPI